MSSARQSSSRTKLHIRRFEDGQRRGGLGREQQTYVGLRRSRSESMTIGACPRDTRWEYADTAWGSPTSSRVTCPRALNHDFRGVSVKARAARRDCWYLNDSHRVSNQENMLAGKHIWREVFKVLRDMLAEADTLSLRERVRLRGQASEDEDR